LKKAWFSSLDGGASNDVIVVRAKTETNNKYLAFLLMNDEFINYVMKSAKGVKMPRGDIATMKQYPLSIPSSTDEQQKIADCLSSIDELITSQIKKVEALKEHKKGLVQQLFPQDDEEVPKLRFPEFKNTPKWNEDTLIKIAKFRRGSFPQPYGLAKWYDDVNGMPFVQVYDVNNNLHLKSTTKRKISEVAMQQSVFIKKGTLIITIQGSIGRVAITQYDAYIDRTLLLFEEFFKPINKLFFAYIIQTLFAIEKEKAPGGIIKTITKEVLSSFVVKLTSIEEQEKIADFIFSIDNLIDSQSKKVKALKEHKKGLMQQLFV
jgi:type I restriction enzyme S subunit